MSSKSSEEFVKEQKCGEIFITGRNIVFHCLCEKKYISFGEYITHLDDHFPVFNMLNEKSFEELQIKEETKLDNNLMDETDIYFTEIERISIDENEENPSCKDKGNSKEIICEDAPSRPVRTKTMYFQQPGEIRNYKCSLCNAAFKDKNGLQKHMERHRMQKSHQCPQCPKKFYTPVDVKVHLRSHSNERPFLCTICGKTFLSNVHLKDHMRRHTNQKDYKCPHCEKCFYNSNLLIGHLPVHTKERPHKCDLCDASFAYRKGLRNHIKLHENKRAYKCELCDATFNQQAGIFCHMKNKHKA